MTRTSSGSPERSKGRGRRRREEKPPGLGAALIAAVFGTHRPDGVLKPGSDWRPAQRAEALRRLTAQLAKWGTLGFPEELAVLAMRRSGIWFAPDIDAAKAALQGLERAIAEAPPSFNHHEGERHQLALVLADHASARPVVAPPPLAERPVDLLRMLGRPEDDGTTLSVVAGRVKLRYRVGGQADDGPKLRLTLPDVEIAFGGVDADELAVVVDAAAVLGLISEAGLGAVAPLLRGAAHALRHGDRDAAINLLRRVGAGEWTVGVSKPVASLDEAVVDALKTGKRLIGVVGDDVAQAFADRLPPKWRVEVMRSASPWEGCLKAIPLVNAGAIVVVVLPPDDPEAISALKHVAQTTGSEPAIVSHEPPPAGAPEWWPVTVTGMGCLVIEKRGH